MADTTTLQFDLVSPERKLASVEAREVMIPSSEGDMTVMPAHMPVIATLRPGILRVVGHDGTQDFVVSGGFAEITADSASVLAEKALPRGDVTQEFVDDLRREAEAAHEAAEGQGKDATAKTLADLTQLAQDMV